MKKHLPCYMVFVVLLGVGTAAAGTNLVGSIAPSPILSTLSGQYLALSKLCYQGPVRPREPRTAVVLNFMSLKCPPCHKELPLFLEVVRAAALEAEKNKTPFRFFLVSIDPLSAKEDVRQFMLEKKISVDSQLLLDPYKKTADKFGVVSIPRTFVISPCGRITADISGAVNNYGALLAAGIREALKAEEPK